MSFELSQELPENMQDILRSAVNVVNEDFDYDKFSRAFPNNSDPWLSKTKSNPGLNPQMPIERRTESSFSNDGMRSCPTVRQPVFTFDEGSFTPKESHYQYFPKLENNHNDKLKNIMNENNIRKAITDMVNQNGVNLNTPALKVQITGNPNYELDESDILNLFSRYGKVVSINVVKHRTAFIIFDDIINALYAQKSLNNQYVRHLDIKLYVSWSNGKEETMYNNGNNKNESTSKSLPNLDAVPIFSYNPAKFTCKYEIQIDNDKDFKIARKIIGPKGCNMKKIIELCQMHLNRRDLSMQSDFLKLRLRGRGSGFKEGPEQRESDDPLHLCVSSKYQDVYSLACKYVEDLIGSLYKEYEVFCQKAGRPISEPVQIKRIEIYNGTEKKLSGEEPKLPNLRQRKSSIETHMVQHMKSLNLSGNSNSPQGSPNNSLNALSDKENSSPSAQFGISSQTELTKSP